MRSIRFKRCFISSISWQTLLYDEGRPKKVLLQQFAVCRHNRFLNCLACCRQSQQRLPDAVLRVLHTKAPAGHIHHRCPAAICPGASQGSCPVLKGACGGDCCVAERQGGSRQESCIQGEHVCADPGQTDAVKFLAGHSAKKGGKGK